MATGEALIELFHMNPVDMTVPYRWNDLTVLRWLNESQREACIRSELIIDTTTSDVCEISVSTGVASYVVNDLVVKLNGAFLVTDGTTKQLEIYDREEATRIFPEWRTTSDTPTGVILEGKNIILNRIPIADSTLKLEVARLPMEDITVSTSPEIQSIHHEALVDWALYRAHLVEDDDEDQPRGRWKKYLDRFESYFGKRPNVDLRRKTEVNRPHRTKAWW